jgi:hypothetical protein
MLNQALAGVGNILRQATKPDLTSVARDERLDVGRTERGADLPCSPRPPVVRDYRVVHEKLIASVPMFAWRAGC